jgi:uncharacterized protein (TIGR02118 family)
MVVISVMYPSTPGTTFDMDYYYGSHVPLVCELLEPMGQREIRVYRGLPNADGSEPDFRLIAELLFDDIESLSAALAAHGPRTQADIPNFTDSIPVIQISEVVAL